MVQKENPLNPYDSKGIIMYTIRDSNPRHPDYVATFCTFCKSLCHKACKDFSEAFESHFESLPTFSTRFSTSLTMASVDF